ATVLGRERNHARLVHFPVSRRAHPGARTGGRGFRGSVCGRAAGTLRATRREGPLQEGTGRRDSGLHGNLFAVRGSGKSGDPSENGGGKPGRKRPARAGMVDGARLRSPSLKPARQAAEGRRTRNHAPPKPLSSPKAASGAGGPLSTRRIILAGGCGLAFGAAFAN